MRTADVTAGPSPSTPPTRAPGARRVLAGLALAALLTGCSSPSTTPATSTPATTAAASSGSTAEAGYGTGECAPADGVATPVLAFDDAFANCLDPGTTYTATFVTSEGTVVVQLDPTSAPIATNNFVNLARSGYFDHTDLFRTEAKTGIIQGGSPHTQNNRDPGPGYSIPDDAGLPLTSADYTPGVIAMANSGPDSGGGQFFFVSREAGSYLGDPSAIGASAGAYVVFGQATEGLDVLQAISDLEVPGTSAPSTPVTIESVTITES